MVCLARFKPTLFGHLDVPTIKSCAPSLRQCWLCVSFILPQSASSYNNKQPLNTNRVMLLDAPFQVATNSFSQLRKVCFEGRFAEFTVIQRPPSRTRISVIPGVHGFFQRFLPNSTCLSFLILIHCEKGQNQVVHSFYVLTYLNNTKFRYL